MLSTTTTTTTNADTTVFPQVPSPRSGCQMSVSVAGDCVFVCGGYSKLKQPDKKSEGKVHEDMWVLQLKNLPNGGSPVWERVSMITTTTTTSAAAASTTTHHHYYYYYYYYYYYHHYS